MQNLELQKLNAEKTITISTLGGWVAFVTAVGLCEHARAVPRTLMSSTMIVRAGIVKPNSRLYLCACVWRGSNQQGKDGKLGNIKPVERAITCYERISVQKRVSGK